MRCVIAFLLVLWPASALATDYYFSDCGFDPTTMGDADLAAHPNACTGGPGTPSISSCLCDPTPDGGGGWLYVCNVLICPAPSDSDPGQRCNPWCLSPEAQYEVPPNRNSFETMMDEGAGTKLPTELAAGDTVRLCAGACDGTGSATFHLSAHTCDGDSALCVFDPEQSGTSSRAIIVEPYCAGSSCETVTLSGDTDGSGTYEQGTEPVRLWSNRSTNGPHTRDGTSGHDYWNWIGDPNGDGVPNLIVEKFGESAFFQARGGTGNIYQGTRIRYIGAGTKVAAKNSRCRALDYPWDCCTGSGTGTCTGDTEGFYGGMPTAFVWPLGQGGGGMVDAQCSWEEIDDTCGLDACSIFQWSQMYEGEDLTIRNNIFEHSCANGLRHNNNCNGDNEACAEGGNAPGTQLIENNTFTDIDGIGQGHQGKHIIYRGNTARDFWYGIQIEEQMTHITVEDNDLGCPGTYLVGYSRGCGAPAISISNGDNETDCDLVDGGATEDCAATDILVQRNKIWGANVPDGAGRNAGYMNGGIMFTAKNQAGTCQNCAVQNNMIWGIQRHNSCVYDTSDVGKFPLTIGSNSPITVQGNTLYDVSCPAWLFGASHIFKDNAIFGAYQRQQGVDAPELYLWESAACSEVNYNVLKDGTTTGDQDPIFCIGADDSGGCSPADDADYGCLAAGGGNGAFQNYRLGNSCGACTFLNANPNGTGRSTWNLHLNTSDTTCKNKGISGPVDDIDKQLRPTPADIGADEILTGQLGSSDFLLFFTWGSLRIRR